MNLQEIAQAETLLQDRVDRNERTGTDTEGGWALTAHWLDGGQRLFYTIDEVRDHVESH
jgi:hypothetical protein